MGGLEMSTLPNLEFSLASRKENFKCVFISHKKDDEDAAIAIGKFLKDECDLNIYLDIQDCELQEAVSVENDKKIVESIKKGLDISTSLLCLVSDKTQLSWWVPFEVGYAERKGISIATQKIKAVENIPSFLKVHEVLNNQNDLIKF